MKKQKNDAKEVEQITSLLAKLNSKVQLDDSLTYMEKDDFDSILEQVDLLSSNLFSTDKSSGYAKERLDELTRIMTNIADLNFSERATVSDLPDNHFDFLAIGLNLMSHQLQKKLRDLKLYKSAFNAVNDPIIVTDIEGRFLIANNAFYRFYKGAIHGLKNKSIKEILLEDKWFQEYKIEITNTLLSIDLKRQIIGNEEAKLLLQVSSTMLKDDENKDKTIGILHTMKLKKSETLQTQKSLKKTVAARRYEELMAEFNGFQKRMNEKFEEVLRESENRDDFIRELEEALIDRRNNLNKMEQWMLIAIEALRDKESSN